MTQLLSDSAVEHETHTQRLLVGSLAMAMASASLESDDESDIVNLGFDEDSIRNELPILTDAPSEEQPSLLHGGKLGSRRADNKRKDAGTNHEYQEDSSVASGGAIQPSKPVLPDITEDDPSLERAEELLISEMNQLSFQERNELYEDLHGVAEPIQERAAFIDQKLTEMQEQIQDFERETSLNVWSDSLLNRQVGRYRIAVNQNSEYTSDRSFRLMFLRSEKFRAKEAARRMLYHIDQKAELFGIELLTRNIALDDLNDDDIEALESNFMKILPVRDRSGRALILINPCSPPIDQLVPMKRAYWFAAMRMLDDPLTQINGCVCVINGFGETSIESLHLVREFAFLDKAIPMFTPGTHYCTDNAEVAKYVPAFQYFSIKEIRIRTRINIGLGNDQQQYLQSFGILLASLGIPVFSERMFAEIAETMEAQRQRLQRQHRQRLRIKNSHEEDECDNSDSHAMSVGSGGSQFGSSSFPSFLAMRPDPPENCSESESMAEFCESSAATHEVEMTEMHIETNTESNATDVLIISTPGEYDVLFGKGSSRNHIGNLRIEELIINMFRDEYEASSRGGKNRIAREVLGKIKESGGRFLKHTRDILEEDGAGFGKGTIEALDGKCGWVEVPDDSAHDKIVKTFWKVRKTKKPRKKSA